MLIDRDGPGDRDKAFRLLSEAIAMYRQIGMPRHVETAEAMLGKVKAPYRKFGSRFWSSTESCA